MYDEAITWRRPLWTQAACCKSPDSDLSRLPATSGRLPASALIVSRPACHDDVEP